MDLAEVKEYFLALRQADLALQAERDRRYTSEREADQRALQIKEEGNQIALVLAREIQTYKDQQHNGVLDQLKEERATYATKAEVAPVITYMAGQQGEKGGRLSQQQLLVMIISLVGSLILIGGTLVSIAFYVRR